MTATRFRYYLRFTGSRPSATAEQPTPRRWCNQTHASSFTTDLASMKTQWTEAARPLQLLIGKLSTLRAALAQIKDWVDFNASTSPNGEEMQGNLGVAIEGCQVIIEALDRETTSLLGDSLVSRLKQFFFDSVIREYENRLASQITALQLLLTAAYCY
ncbi:uncharacterized protein B0H64DRAFT_174561 [Chaetomium fimeti]|uniref:Uncharacterized protein n=1 Tax=Chaetomium fimeti TaxID=1854472 RepID=A0AAE0HC99_9PEZI|nr:hypothetical protein B0H64DRAFT_174561 [Chaetomium fimeti]